MVAAIIFFIHFIFILIVFIKKWQTDSILSAFLDLSLIGILFSVGWSLTDLLTKLFLKPAGFGYYFNRNDLSLTLLTIAEYFFYKMYYSDIFTIEDDTEKQ